MVCMYHLPNQWIKFDSDNIDRLKSAKGGEDRDGRSVQTCLGGRTKCAGTGLICIANGSCKATASNVQ
jgi:hypothetical protein